jgi:hypothetical protein
MRSPPASSPRSERFSDRQPVRGVLALVALGVWQSGRQERCAGNGTRGERASRQNQAERAEAIRDDVGHYWKDSPTRPGERALKRSRMRMRRGRNAAASPLCGRVEPQAEVR